MYFNNPNRKTRLLSVKKRCSYLGAAAVLTMASTYSYAEKPRLFDASPTLEKQLTSAKLQRLSDIKHELTSRSVEVIRIDPSVLNADELELPLAGDNRRGLTKLKVHNRSSKSFSWFGKLKDVQGDATLVVNDGQVTGTIRDQGEIYKIEPLGDGLHAIIKVDQSRFPPEHPEAFKQVPVGTYPKSAFTQDGAVSADSFSSQLLAATATAAAVVPTEIDVLVAYTASARSSVSDINSTIQLAVDEANQSYINSGVNIHLNLVDRFETTLTEASNTQQTLNNFNSDATINGRRNASGADMAVMITNQNEYCGMANAIMATSTNAFAVVHYSCATGNYTFAHELGHLQGARHDPAADSTATPFAYGHGFQSLTTSPTWRTIMAYDCPSGCGRIPNWSNPNVTYGGAPTGTTGTNNNARVLNETAATVAGFKATAPVGASLAPMNIKKTVAGVASYELASSGYIVTSNAASAGTSIAGAWLNPRAGMSDYEARATSLSASPFCLYSGTLNTWINLGVGAKWVDNGYYAYYDIPCRLRIEIRKASVPATILATADISLMGKQ